MADFDPVAMLRLLHAHRVQFLVVGGIAARLRGAPLLTQDVDITPAPDRANLERLAGALKDLDARLRTATEPDGVPFPFDPGLLENATVWTLTTKHGDLDLVVSPAGTDGYRDLIRDADELNVATEPDLVCSGRLACRCDPEQRGSGPGEGPRRPPPPTKNPRRDRRLNLHPFFTSSPHSGPILRSSLL